MVVKESSIPILPLVRKSTDNVGMSKNWYVCNSKVSMANIWRNHWKSSKLLPLGNGSGVEGGGVLFSFISLVIQFDFNFVHVDKKWIYKKKERGRKWKPHQQALVSAGICRNGWGKNGERNIIAWNCPGPRHPPLGCVRAARSPPLRACNSVCYKLRAPDQKVLH